MANSNLTQAKNAKNDEFYTQWADIEKEVQAYLEFDSDVFRGKTILCPCDDPEWSNFTKFFALHFNEYGLKKLISTSYANDSKNYKGGYQISLFEMNDPKFDEKKTTSKGKIFVLENKDINHDGKVNIEDLKWNYMNGDGDFRSKEVTKLRDESDIIITNPPFSLFREFLPWITKSKKRFLIIANKSVITYKEVFPLLKENMLWSGITNWSGGMWFETKDLNDVDKVIDGINMKNTPSFFLTNLDHGRRHYPLPLMTMEDNVKFSKHKDDKKWEAAYKKYDNYDAIEVPFTDAIPSDYHGIMGVPVSFLDKYCSEQFRIIGMAEDNGMGFSGGIWDGKNPHCVIDGDNKFKRIFIQSKGEDSQ